MILSRFYRMLVFALLSSACFGEQLLLIEGTHGDESFSEPFDRTVATWKQLATEASFEIEHVHDTTSESIPKERIQNWISNNLSTRADTLWIVYVGHGTFASDGAKLNLEGPDVSAVEMAEWLAELQRPLVFVHGGASSAPFLNALAGENRILITATRSGTEQNYARFGSYFAESLKAERSDIDLDGRVSLLEAFVGASAKVETFYREAGRLTSEHALIDDNGDGLGTPATSYKGLQPRSDDVEDRMRIDGRIAKRVSILPAAGELNLSVAQLEEREKLESKLEELYLKKDSMETDVYYDELEAILIELSELYVEQPSDS